MDNLNNLSSELLIIIILYLQKYEIYNNIICLSQYWNNILKINSNPNEDTYLISNQLNINLLVELKLKNLKYNYKYVETINCIETLHSYYDLSCFNRFKNLKSLKFTNCRFITLNFELLPKTLDSIFFEDVVINHLLPIPSYVTSISLKDITYNREITQLFKHCLDSLEMGFQFPHYSIDSVVQNSIFKGIHLVRTTYQGLKTLKLSFTHDFLYDFMIQLPLSLTELYLKGSKDMLKRLILPIDLNFAEFTDTSISLIQINNELPNLSYLKCLDVIFCEREAFFSKKLQTLILKYSNFPVISNNMIIEFEKECEIHTLFFENIQIQNKLILPKSLKYYKNIYTSIQADAA